MRYIHVPGLLIMSALFILSCNKPSENPNPGPGLPDPVIKNISPAHAPLNTKVTIEFNRYLDPPEAPTKVLVAGVSIPFSYPNSGSFSMIDFTVPKGMASGQVQVEWKGKLLNGPTFTYDSLYYVSTIAGKAATSGSTNGPIASALFNNPYRLAIDKDGNIYVAEKDNHRIRKISVAGNVTTIAGTGVAGYADGPGASSQFNEPSDIAIDNNGNLFVADRANGRIRKIAPDGQTSTFAGKSFGGGNWEGDGTNANIAYPFGIDIDASGDLYVVSDNQLLKITAAAKVTILAGGTYSGDKDGTGTNAAFSNPQDVAVAANGDLFVCEQGNNKIRKVTQAGVVTTFAGAGGPTGGYANGIGTAAKFEIPSSIVAGGDGNLYCLEYGNELVRIITPDANVNKFAGSYHSFGYRDGLATQALFYDPYGIATDKKGNFYVADTKNHCIRKISKE